MISFYFQVDFGFNLRTYLDQYNNILILILFEFGIKRRTF